MPHWNNQPWQRNLSKIASGKPGAVQWIGLRVHLLHEWYDVDEAQDFQRLKAEFDGQPPFPDAVIKGGPAWYTRALLADWAATEITLRQQKNQG